MFIVHWDKLEEFEGIQMRFGENTYFFIYYIILVRFTKGSGQIWNIELGKMFK